MKGKVSRFEILSALLRKDIALFSRDLLFVFLSILSVVSFAVLYWVLPKSVNETITVGIHGEGLEAAFERIAGESAEEGMALKWYEDGETLKQAVTERDLQVGFDFPEDFLSAAASGKGTRVTVYVHPNLPPEIRQAMTSAVREIAFAISGNPLPVTFPEEDTIILGVDRAGNQVPFRDKLKPLYAFMVLVIEVISLGALISSEVQNRTLTALLSTPARIGDILAAKGLLGTFIAFSESVIVMFLIRGFGSSPGIVLVALLLGAVMVTRLAMIAGSAGKDLMGTMLFSLLFLIPLMIPAFAVLFPGSLALWLQYLPSYGLVKTVLISTTEGAGWADSAGNLLMLGGWCILFFVIGVLVLRRRVVTL